MAEKDFYQISLKLILKDKQGRVLILKAEDNSSFAGYWDLPGGRIDDNEFSIDFKEIIKREIIEEVGNIDFSIDDKPVALSRAILKKPDHNGNLIKILYVMFTGEYFSGDIKISQEHTEYKWFDLKSEKLEDYFVSGILEGLKMYLA